MVEVKIFQDGELKGEFKGGFCGVYRILQDRKKGCAAQQSFLRRESAAERDKSSAG